MQNHGYGPARWLTATAALALALGVAGTACAEDVSFALNWVPGPQHTEFVAAQHHGFFEAQGLTVDMHPPAASTDTLKLVASGQDQFGIAYAGDVIQARAQGVPVVSVAAIHRHIALGLLSRPADNIRTPQDLEGKVIGLTPVPTNRAMFEDFVEKNGLDRDSMDVQTVQFNGPHVVAADSADVADAVSWYELGVYKQLTGEMPSYMEYTDFGVPDGYYFTIITSEDFLASNPETVSRFVAAILEAEKWTVENPDEARAVLLANVPEVSEEFAQQSRSVIDGLVTDADTEAHGLGWQSDAVWQQMVDWFFEEGLIPEKIDAASAFSNDFLPAAPVSVQR